MNIPGVGKKLSNYIPCDRYGRYFDRLDFNGGWSCPANIANKVYSKRYFFSKDDLKNLSGVVTVSNIFEVIYGSCHLDITPYYENTPMEEVCVQYAIPYTSEQKLGLYKTYTVFIALSMCNNTSTVVLPNFAEAEYACVILNYKRSAPDRIYAPPFGRVAYNQDVVWCNSKANSSIAVTGGYNVSQGGAVAAIRNAVKLDTQWVTDTCLQCTSLGQPPRWATIPYAHEGNDFEQFFGSAYSSYRDKSADVVNLMIRVPFLNYTNIISTGPTYDNTSVSPILAWLGVLVEPVGFSIADVTAIISDPKYDSTSVVVNYARGTYSTRMLPEEPLQVYITNPIFSDMTVNPVSNSELFYKVPLASSPYAYIASTGNKAGSIPYLCNLSFNLFLKTTEDTPLTFNIYCGILTDEATNILTGAQFKEALDNFSSFSCNFINPTISIT